MALGALISFSFWLEAPAEGVRQEFNNLNLFSDIRPTAVQAFPLPSNLPSNLQTVARGPSAATPLSSIHKTAWKKEP